MSDAIRASVEWRVINKSLPDAKTIQIKVVKIIPLTNRIHGSTVYHITEFHHTKHKPQNIGFSEIYVAQQPVKG